MKQLSAPYHKQIKFFVVASGLLVFSFPARVSAAVIASWSFDANFNDTSGNGNHFTQASGTVALVPGLFGNAAEFTSASGYLESTASALIATRSQFSMGLWMKDQGTIDRDGNLLGRLFNMGITVDSTRAWAYVRDGGNHATSTGVVTGGNWHFLVQTFDGSTIQLYRDGILEHSVTSMFLDTGSFTHFYAGANGLGVNRYRGLVDNAFLRSDVLSAGQITSLFSAPEPSTLLLMIPALFSLPYIHKKRRLSNII